MLCAGRCVAIAADQISRVLPSRIDKKSRDISCVETGMAQRSHRCLRLSFLLEASCDDGGHGALLDDLQAAALPPSCGMNNVMLRTFVVRTQELHRLGKSFCARRLGTATYADRAENVPRGMRPRWVGAE